MKLLSASSRARVVWLILTAGVLLAPTGCSSDEPSPKPGIATASPSGAVSSSLPPGPPVSAESQVSTEKLVIAYEGEEDVLARAVDQFDGEVISNDQRVHIYIARFPTRDVESLVRIRDALRAQGFDAAVTPTLPDL